MASYSKYVQECKSTNTSLLGNLVMVSVSDQNVSRYKLINAMYDRGLSTLYVPAPTREIDAWKKACAVVNNTKFTNLDGTRTTYLVRELDNTTRAVMQEVTDSENKRLSYRPVATTTISEFVKDETRTWDWSNYTPEGYAVDLDDNEREQVIELRTIFNRIASDTYDALDGSRMRRLVMNTLKSKNGFEVRPSVWFLANEHSETLAKFTEALHEVTQAVKLILVPLIDMDSQREMVIEAYRTESAQEMQNLLKSALHLIEQVKSGTTVRAKTVQQLFESYNQQVATAQVYANEFTTSVDHLQETATLAKDALARLKGMI